MKNISIKWGLLGMLLVWSACEKVEIPDSTVSGMPFGIKGQIEGKNLDLGTYQSGVKMQTDVEWVENSVWQFTGTLHEGNQGGRALQIQIRNRREGRDSSIADWKEYKNDSLTFQREGGKQDSVHMLKILVENSENLPINFVQCGDQRKTGDSNVKEFLLPQRDIAKVTVDYGQENKTGSFTTVVLPGPQASNSFPNWVVGTTTSESAKLIARMSNTAGANIVSYDWGNGPSNSETITTQNSGLYEVIMKDQLGRTYQHRKRLLYNNSDHFFTYGNSFIFKADWMPAIVQTDKKQLRSVRITYRDKNDDLYFSDLGEHAINRFAIDEIKLFEKDARGKLTLAIKVRFSARLTNRQGNVITLENCSGWFAVGLP